MRFGTFQVSIYEVYLDVGLVKKCLNDKRDRQLLKWLILGGQHTIENLS